MTDELPPTIDDGDGEGDGDHVALAGNLRVLLAAHVDETIATDEAWAEIVRAAREQGTARTRRRTAVIAVLAAAALVAAFVVVRLETSRDEGAQVSTEPDASPDPTEGTAPDSWVRLLAHVPVTDDATPLFLVDLAQARAQAGVEPLADGAPEAAWQAQSSATFGTENILNSSVPFASPEELRAELGFGHEQFDQVAVRGVSGGGPRYVATGRFDPATIASTVEADPLWGPELEIREHRGLTYYRWGEEMRLTDKRSPVRELGVGGRLVVGDGWIAWTSTDADAEATIDASLDPRISLVSNEPIRLAAQSADGAGLIKAIISIRGDDEPVSSTTPIPGPLPDLPLIDRPESWSGGSGRPESVEIEQFRIGYASEEQAANNLEAFAANWERFAGHHDVTVGREGSGLVAIVRLPDADETGVVGVLSDGTSQRLNPGSFVLYLNVPRP